MRAQASPTASLRVIAMKIEQATVARAFEAFNDRYVVNATRAWDLDHHARLWQKAQSAVGSGDVAGFSEVLGELRSYWRIARGRAATMAEPDRVLPLLNTLPREAAKRRLSSLSDDDSEWLLKSVHGASDIKR